jgi:phage terminase large subunit-like protein
VVLGAARHSTQELPEATLQSAEVKSPAVVQSPSLRDAAKREVEQISLSPDAPEGEGVPRHGLTEKQEEGNRFLARPGRHKFLFGGARSGKTFLFTRAVVTRALKASASRHAILRLRANAVRASIALDTLPKVMRLCFPGVAIEEHRMDGYFEFPHNESQLWVGGLDDKERVEKILGQEYATIFLNECSQIPYASVLYARTRLAQNIQGLAQRMYYDLNPTGKKHWSNMESGLKLDPTSKQPLKDPHNYDRMQVNPSDNLAHLSQEYLDSLDLLPEKQRRRFYLGEYVDEVDNALWTYDRFDQVRIDISELPQMQRIVIAVDPSGARALEDVRSDEIGIIPCGRDYGGRGYVLEDLSCRLGPSGWARRAVEAYHRWGADAIVAEINFGKAMVEETIRSVDPNIPIRTVTASRGKAVRAEPVSNLYDERINRVSHVGKMPDLEDQLCMFSTAGYMGEKSPDRADAMIWGLSELLIGAGLPQLLFG